MSHIVFCDGACSGNPGPGGWGVIVATSKGEVTERGGFEDRTTNNRMELRASIEALKLLDGTPGPVKMHTDSSYVINGITKWIFGWRRNGWKTAQGAEVINRDLWEELFAWVAARKNGGRTELVKGAFHAFSEDDSIDWIYVPGHEGVPGNERVDAIAVAYSQRTQIPLYNGPRSGYRVDLNQIQAVNPPSPSTPKTKTSGPVYYVSYVGGKVERHKTWGECEARVKGASGAKYKKVKSEAEEAEVLAAWGVR